MSGRRGARVQVPGLAQLAEVQAQAVSRSQLRTFGVDARAVAHQVAAERWQEAGPLVVVLHTGEVAPSSRRWVSVLTAGPRGALCAWSALAEWGLAGWERPADHVVVPRGAVPPELPWSQVHESRRHAPTDVRRRHGLPVHAVERAAVDAAAWSSTPRAAGGVLAAVVQQRLTTPERVAAALDAAGRVQHRTLMRAVLADLSGGSTSMAEIDLVQLCQAGGLPVPLRQQRRRDASGRWRYLDAEWRTRTGRALLLEVDGALHVEVRRWYDDALRHAEVVRPGEVLLRLPALALRTEPERVVAVLRRHLEG